MKNKEIKLSFEEQDVIFRSSPENDVVIMRSQEMDGSSYYDLYLTKEEAEQLCKELIKFFD